MGGGGRNSRYGFVAREAVCVIRASNAESVPLMRGNNDLACLSLLSPLSLPLSLSLLLRVARQPAASLSLRHQTPLITHRRCHSARYEPDLFQTEDRQQVSLCDRARNRHTVRPAIPGAPSYFRSSLNQSTNSRIDLNWVFRIFDSPFRVEFWSFSNSLFSYGIFVEFFFKEARKNRFVPIVYNGSR